MKNSKAVIFDCFGVLYLNAGEAYFSQFPEKYEELHKLSTLSDHGLINRSDYTLAVSHITGDPVSEVEAAFRKEHTLNRPLIEFIQKDLKPSFKLALLSNIGREWIQDFFDEHQLHDLFDVVVLSAEEGITKPNPVIFERTARRLGLQPTECLFVDDLEKNCTGAEAVGMKAIVYKNVTSLKQLLQ